MGPTTGICEKQAVTNVAVAPRKLPSLNDAAISGLARMDETSAMPVSAQTTTVSQKVPVMETSA